jgi:uncharacterized protein YuzB (UPF0349 family)
MEIKYCDRCKRRGDLVRSQLLPRLKKEFPQAAFDSMCLSVCGIGSRKSVVFVNDQLIYADSDDELIDKIKDVVAAGI